MSYRSPPPPPPAKSSYGDTELTDDGWSQQSGPPKFTNYPQGNMGGQPMQPAFNQGVGSRYAPGNIQNIGQGQNPSVPDLATLSNTMTQDDILFMRRVRRDCFFFRVVPMVSVSCGCFYLYNKSRHLPQSFGRFVGVGIFSTILAITNFRGRFHQMIAESKSNSLYMQTLRRSMGAAALVPGSDFSGDQSVEYGSKIGDGSTNWDATELSSDLRYDARPEMSTPGQFYNDTSYQPLDPGNQEAPKPAATYEELRSRNRGHSR